LGAADYLAIEGAFPAVFVREIPRMKLEMINSMRQFITFVDCMYDQGVRLHCLVVAAPGDLYQVDNRVSMNYLSLTVQSHDNWIWAVLAHAKAFQSESPNRSTENTMEQHTHLV
jgi:predicted ATPase